MERKIVCKPNKEIRPFLVQFFLYLGVTVGGALLLNAQSPLLDKLLVAALALCSLGYGFYHGRRIFRTSYTVEDGRVEIKKRGRIRVFTGDDVALSYYDSNTKNMELHLKDGNIIMLVEYDNLTPMVDFLDQAGVRIDYKRIALR